MIFVNGIRIEPTIFPDGTSQVWKLPEELFFAQSVKVDWRFESEREIVDLYSLSELIRGRWTLYVPYLPYARQDKGVNNATTFNLRAFARLINPLEFDQVTAVDVHNPKETTRLIQNFKNIELRDWHLQVMNIVRPTCVVFPDIGAFERYEYLKPESRFVFHKTRDPLTGEITGHDYSYKDCMRIGVSGKDPSIFISRDDRFLIIDDLCDGGATFLSIAKALRKIHEHVPITLCVTHGVFSKGREHLMKQNIDLITTDSLPKNFRKGFKV
jgi:ribose-phosphate pyrophosphokinase